MRLYSRFWLLCGLAACLVPEILAQCPHVSVGEGNAVSGTASASTSPPAETTMDQRTVLLSLVISKSGVVRDATPLSGPLMLRKAAIEAAKRGKYKSKLNGSATPRQMMVAVTFAPGKDTAPEIQEALSAGVPACVPFPTAVRISAAVMQTHLLSRIDPVYPPEALAQHVEAVVVLQIRIDKNGSVYKAEKISGADVLVPAAIEAVKQWKYQPYLLSGEPVEVETTIELSFTS